MNIEDLSSGAHGNGGNQNASMGNLNSGYDKERMMQQFTSLTQKIKI